jgi:hypothetical protein
MFLLISDHKLTVMASHCLQYQAVVRKRAASADLLDKDSAPCAFTRPTSRIVDGKNWHEASTGGTSRSAMIDGEGVDRRRLAGDGPLLGICDPYPVDKPYKYNLDVTDALAILACLCH